MKHMDAADQTPNDDNVLTEKPRKGATGRGLKRVRGPKKPSKYAVVLHNDNYTPMDFVTQLLMQVFHKDSITAKAITQHVHNSGRGIAGVYSREIAETKTHECMAVAKSYEHPLMIDFEPE